MNIEVIFARSPFIGHWFCSWIGFGELSYSDKLFGQHGSRFVYARIEFVFGPSQDILSSINKKKTRKGVTGFHISSRMWFPESSAVTKRLVTFGPWVVLHVSSGKLSELSNPRMFALWDFHTVSKEETEPVFLEKKVWMWECGEKSLGLLVKA